jgi:site-specific DNA-methyltransferase (adenine-specific)
VPKQSKPVTRPSKKDKSFYSQKPPGKSPTDIPHAKLIAPSPFTLREDGTIESETAKHADHAKSDSTLATSASLAVEIPRLIFTHDSPFVRLYHGNSLELLDAIAAKYPEGRFDCIFADPPYFLSNGGITCHAGKMVKVDKGDWDKSRGPELNHEFNKEWLKRCQRVLKPNGTIWVSGTHHVIFSIGYAMQELGYKILNDIAWEKPNPPPNLSCRYFTHSTETILWAAKSEKSKHVFNYAAMKSVTGKQMKTVWTMSAPRREEKAFGKHPTQKPIALIERCLLASTNEHDLVLDAFLGSGTTAIACIRSNRNFIGIELDLHHLALAKTRTDRTIVEIWLKHFTVRVNISIAGRAVLPRRPNFREASPSSTPDPRPSQIDLDLFPDSINGSPVADDKPQIATERIFHETKFVFLSCAEVAHGSVVHTTVDISLQEAWAKTPTGKKRETTHIVKCETEILRVSDNS